MAASSSSQTPELRRQKQRAGLMADPPYVLSLEYDNRICYINRSGRRQPPDELPQPSVVSAPSRRRNMSCDSTSGNSVIAPGATSLPFPDLGWSWKIPLASLGAIALWLDRRYEYRQLLELDDHLLADIGLSRTDVEQVRRSHLYLMAWHDSR